MTVSAPSYVDEHPSPGVTVRRYPDGTAGLYVGGWAPTSTRYKTEAGLARAVAKWAAAGAEAAARKAEVSASICGVCGERQDAHLGHMGGPRQADRPNQEVDDEWFHTRYAGILITHSGARRMIPLALKQDRIVGLDGEGRIVVDDFDAFNAEPITVAGFTQQPFLFGLTLCCDASDKGTESGVCCRACYGTKWGADEGQYLPRATDGSFPGLDPVVAIICTPKENQS